MAIGDKIKELRIKKGLTQRTLASLSGISEISIRKYEGGQRYPKYESVEKIADALEVPIYELISIDEQNDYLNDALGIPKDIREMEKTIRENDKIIHHKILELIDIIIRQDNDLYIKYHKLYGDTPQQFLNTTYCDDIDDTLYHLVKLGVYDILTSNLRTLIKLANQKNYIDALLKKEAEKTL